MGKRKVLIVVHQLNLGGVQKAVLSALDAIDYSQNDVTLYIRKKPHRTTPASQYKCIKDLCKSGQHKAL